MSPEEQLRKTLALQQNAFKTEMNPSLSMRLDRLNRLERMVSEHADAFANAISKDFGHRSEIETIIGEISGFNEEIRNIKRKLSSWMKPERVTTGLLYLPGRSRILRQPLGVTGIISPWNYPLLLAVMPAAGAIAAGNRVMLKVSEHSPAFSELFCKAVSSFFGEDEFAAFSGGSEVGRAFASLPFDHLLFTGSTQTGRAVAEAAAKNLTPVTLELGGKSPLIIDESCDLSLAAEKIAWGKLFNAGQTCIAPDYILVPENKLDILLDKLQAAMKKLYPSFMDNPDYSSAAGERQLKRLNSLLEDAESKGAKIIRLSDEKQLSGSFKIIPAILCNVNENMKIMQEEIFGPLLPVMTYGKLDEAIEYINAHERPLALYFFGENMKNCRHVLKSTISGGVTVNDTILHIAQKNLPFGGVGASGMGHYHGKHGFLRFSKERSVFIQSRFAGVKMLYPPYGRHIRKLLKALSFLT